MRSRDRSRRSPSGSLASAIRDWEEGGWSNMNFTETRSSRRPSSEGRDPRSRSSSRVRLAGTSGRGERTRTDRPDSSGSARRDRESSPGRGRALQTAGPDPRRHGSRSRPSSSESQSALRRTSGSRHSLPRQRYLPPPGPTREYDPAHGSSDGGAYRRWADDPLIPSRGSFGEFTTATSPSASPDRSRQVPRGDSVYGGNLPLYRGTGSNAVDLDGPLTPNTSAFAQREADRELASHRTRLEADRPARNARKRGKK